MIPLSGRWGPASAAALLAIGLVPAVCAQSAAARPQPYALKNVRLSADEDSTRTILIEAGRIAAILYDTESFPANMRVIDCEELVAVPAFVDAFTGAGCETTAPQADRDDPVPTDANVLIDMRQANRKGIQPSFRAAEVFALEEKRAETYRQNGFAALLSAPRGEILAGVSALATTRDAAARDVMERGEVFQHAAFSASGGGYPGTLMAYHAQFRQFFLDAQRQRELQRRYEEGRPGTRPPFDADLEAAWGLLDGETMLVCEAETARAIERWVRLADEFGITIAISGGREAYKVADLLVERDIPVYMTLDWGEEVKDPREKPKKGKKKEKDPEEEGSEPDAEQPDTEAPEGEAPDEAEEQEPEEGAEHAEGEGEESTEKGEKERSWKYEEPFGVRLEKRREWELRRDCALRLADRSPVGR